MVKKEGKFPANARVDVDYSSGKPKIKFDYPKNGKSAKSQAIGQIGFYTLIIPMIILIIIPYVVVIAMSLMSDYQSPPSNCSTFIQNKTYYEYLNVTYVWNLQLICDNKTYDYYWAGTKNELMDEYVGFKQQYKRSYFYYYFISYLILAYIFIIFVIRVQLGKLLIKWKWFQRWYPEHQAKGRKKKYIKFKPEDIENLMVEIPYFKNVMLDYKTHGDFSSKLERIKIHEHQYYNYDMKKKKVGKKQVKLFNWYARFYFKEKPKDGFMEVIFR